jgi:hypothetical protein
MLCRTDVITPCYDALTSFRHVMTHSFWTVLLSARILACHLILFCFHKSIIDENLGVIPKEDVNLVRLRYRSGQTTPSPPTAKPATTKYCVQLIFHCMRKTNGSTMVLEPNSWGPTCPAAAPTPIVSDPMPLHSLRVCKNYSVKPSM